MSTVPSVPLNDGTRIPQLGFGVFQVPADEVREPVRQAIEAGYRSIDTAAFYGNEKGVGQAISDSGVPREELYATTKVWNDRQGYDEAQRSCEESIAKLGLDYLDLVLIHWPAPARDLYVETYRGLERLRADGRVRSIGVSNFLPEHLSRLVAETSVVPVLNQVELHPRLQQSAVRAANAELGIATEAYSPLARGGDVLGDPTVTALADKYGKSPAQVVLRWSIQLGNIVIPKSVTPARIASNLDVFDFELSAEEMERFGALETGARIAPDPATFGS